MLVLARQRDQTIMIGDDIEVTVVDVRGDKVRLGINAPKDVSVHRKEVYEAIRRENREAARPAATPAPAPSLSPAAPLVTRGDSAAHLSVLGATWTPLSITSLCSTFEMRIAPGAALPAVVYHRFDMAYCVVEGAVSLKLQDRILEAAAGTTVTVPRGTMQSIANPGGTEARIMVVSSPGGLEQFLQEAQGTPANGASDASRLSAAAARFGVELSHSKS